MTSSANPPLAHAERRRTPSWAKPTRVAAWIIAVLSARVSSCRRRKSAYGEPVAAQHAKNVGAEPSVAERRSAARSRCARSGCGCRCPIAGCRRPVHHSTDRPPRSRRRPRWARQPRTAKPRSRGRSDARGENRHATGRPHRHTARIAGWERPPRAGPEARLCCCATLRVHTCRGSRPATSVGGGSRSRASARSHHQRRGRRVCATRACWSALIAGGVGKATIGGASPWADAEPSISRCSHAACRCANWLRANHSAGQSDKPTRRSVANPDQISRRRRGLSIAPDLPDRRQCPTWR